MGEGIGLMLYPNIECLFFCNDQIHLTLHQAPYTNEVPVCLADCKYIHTCIDIVLKIIGGLYNIIILEELH